LRGGKKKEKRFELSERGEVSARGKCTAAVGKKKKNRREKPGDFTVPVFWWSQTFLRRNRGMEKSRRDPYTS